MPWKENSSRSGRPWTAQWSRMDWARASMWPGSSWYWLTMRSSGTQRQRDSSRVTASKAAAVVVAEYWG